jgi:tRNA dimethylallyltransferase
MASQNPIIPVLYGPTASGKSSAALDLAREVDGVILNADAMQCYDALPLLTAQPSIHEQADIPHKLYGFISPAQNMIVTDWLKFALSEVEKALIHGNTPILVGGTGFYLQAMIEGLSPIPDIDESYRKEALSLYEEKGLEKLLTDLDAYSPDHAAQLDRHNPQRVIRAWEVLSATGQSLQEWQALPKEKPAPHLVFNVRPVTRPRDDLVKRINQRFDMMMEAGVLDEVQALSDRIDNGEVPEDGLILKAHGFRPLRAYLKGELPRSEAIEKSKAETRQYAKRQMTWMRHQFHLDIPS